MPSKTRRFDENPKTEPAKSKTSPFYMGLEKGRVALNIVPVNLQIVFDLSKPIAIGRGAVHTDNVTVLDLTPFRGDEMGVSRNHLVMKLQDRKLSIIDQDSSNGTFLNGKVLEPNVSYTIMQGDEIMLGLLKIRVDLLTGLVD